MALIHGGDRQGFFESYGSYPLDFSSNTNPLGTAPGVLRAVRRAAKRSHEYPDPLCRRLTAAIAAHEDVPGKYVLCGAGSADLFFRFAYYLRAKKALLPCPCFAEYAAAFQAAGSGVQYHFLAEGDGFRLTRKILDGLDGADVLFLCNPNNPTGLTADPQLLERLLYECGKRGVILAVDECFNGFLAEPEKHTLAKRLKKHPNLILFKAFTKLYGMAGLRLGYCLCSDPALIEGMRSFGQPWSVSTPAEEAGLAALREERYIQKTRALIPAEREYLKSSLAGLGMNIFGGEANYVFFYSDIPSLAGQLAKSGVLIRDCSNFDGLCAGFYRAAVKKHSENRALVDAIKRLR